MNSEITNAEAAVIGGILINCESLPPGLDLLHPNDFIVTPHRQIFRGMLKLHENNNPLDSVTVSKALDGEDPPEGGWFTFVDNLAQITPTAANVEHYAGIVRREARRRDFILATSAAINKANEPGADADDILVGLVLKLGELADGRALTRPVMLSEIMVDEVKAIEARADGALSGVPTGFDSVDAFTGGLEPGGITVIAARPGMGKTSKMCNIMRNLTVIQKKSGLIFSLEMSNQEQAQRFLAADGEVDLRRIRSGMMLNADWPRLSNSAGRLHLAKLAIVDKAGISITELRSIARQYAARNPLDIIAVDYLQLMEGIGDGREQQVASIMRGLKALAKELNVPVIAVSQLNRSLESRQDKRPQLSDLRESGAIEQDAHQVVFIYRDEYYHPKSHDEGLAEISISKNRNGPTGMVKLRWSGKFTRFDSLDYESRAIDETPEAE